MTRFILIIMILFSGAVSAQITAPGSIASRVTSYPVAPGNDPVFIYCSPGGSSPELRADSPGGTPPFTFDWYKWSDADKDFTVAVLTDPATLFSTVSGISEGGYRVRITDGLGYDITLTAWVQTDRPLAAVSLQQALCDQVTLRGRAFIDTFYYADVMTGQAVRLPNDVSFRYSSDPVSLISNPTLHTYNMGDYGLKVLSTPPLEDVWYKLEVTDSFGCVSESSFFYESIHVNADFSVDPERGDAPLEVNFTDNSVRGQYYTWRFGDDTISNLQGSVSHTYYVPGEYTVSLTIESDLGCIDSMRYDKILVEPSSLNIPNVFTPDGNGDNDYFYVDSKSLRFLYVQLFSESGKRVYSFEGRDEALREWRGWDGKIGSGKASPGIYFYIIRASGWDNVIYDGKEYRGFVYLYR